MSDVDMVQRIDRLEDRADEQEFEINRLRSELSTLRSDIVKMLGAVADDIQYLERNKKDDFCA